MVGDDHQGPRPVRGIDAAGGVGEHDDVRPELAEQEDGLDDEPGVVALVDMEPALEHRDRRAPEPAEQEPADVTGRRRRRPAGQVGERDRDRVREVVGQPAEPRSQDDPDLRDQVRPGPDGRLEGVDPGGLVGRRDRAGAIDRAGAVGSAHGRAGLRMGVEGEDGRGPGRQGPDGRTDTGMPVAVRRAVVTRAGTAEAARPGQRSARSDRRGAEVLDVISVSPVPDGPFGQDLR